MGLFNRAPGYEAALYAEAQALLDDGLDLEFVADLYPDDADWLTPLLQTGAAIADAAQADQASYFFEASLKQKFLAEAARKSEAVPALAIVPPSGMSRVRTFSAGAALAGMAAAVGAITFGAVTADTAVPGDWNYAFKQGRERAELALSRGQGRVDVQIRAAEERVQEIMELQSRGEVDEGDLQALQRELADFARVAEHQQLNEAQKQKTKRTTEGAAAVARQVSETKPDLKDAAAETIDEANNAAVAAGVGTPRPLTPTPEPTATPTPTPPATPTESTTPEPSETATPSASETPTPDGSATPEPTTEGTPTVTVEPTLTGVDEPTAAPTESP
jgi:Domain of unknown function (DUF5667)